MPSATWSRRCRKRRALPDYIKTTAGSVAHQTGAHASLPEGGEPDPFDKHAPRRQWTKLVRDWRTHLIEAQEATGCDERGAWADETCDLAELVIIPAACADVLKIFDSGVEARPVAVRVLCGSARRLAFEYAGSRVLQSALQAADKDAAIRLVRVLHGHVLESTRSPHANFVIQRIIELMPRERFGFISDELAGFGADVAKRPFGCRILSRLIEHSAPDMPLADEVLQEVDVLCFHPYGKHAVSSLLEHGTEWQRREILNSLHRHLNRILTDYNSSFVLENALTYAALHEAQPLVAELLASPASREMLTGSKVGRSLAAIIRRRRFKQALLDAVPTPKKSTRRRALC